MKKILKARLLLALVLGLGISLLASNVAKAVAPPLYWDAATNITINSVTYTISAGSGATSTTVEATRLKVTVPASSTLTFTSPDGYALSLSDSTNIVQSCSGNANQLVITGDAAEKIITPDLNTVTCTDSRGYSSGGGGTYVPPAATPTPTPTPTATPVPGTTPTPTATPLPGPTTPNANSGVTLYRMPGDHRVYVVKDGKKNWIKTAEEFNAAGYDWSAISEVSADALAAIPDANPSGATLYRADGDTKVYVVKDNVKQWIKTADEFNAAGYKWSDIVVTTPAAVAAFSDGTAAVTVKVINAASLRVRKSNTTASSVLGSVKKNAIFTALEEKSGWYKITMSNGVIGWISGAYATKQ